MKDNQKWWERVLIRRKFYGRVESRVGNTLTLEDMREVLGQVCGERGTWSRLGGFVSSSENNIHHGPPWEP